MVGYSATVPRSRGWVGPPRGTVFRNSGEVGRRGIPDGGIVTYHPWQRNETQERRTSAGGWPRSGASTSPSTDPRPAPPAARTQNVCPTSREHLYQPTAASALLSPHPGRTICYLRAATSITCYRFRRDCSSCVPRGVLHRRRRAIPPPGVSGRPRPALAGGRGLDLPLGGRVRRRVPGLPGAERGGTGESEKEAKLARSWSNFSLL
jgi:hypothetical protein